MTFWSHFYWLTVFKSLFHISQNKSSQFPLEPTESDAPSPLISACVPFITTVGQRSVLGASSKNGWRSLIGCSPWGLEESLSRV